MRTGTSTEVRDKDDRATRSVQRLEDRHDLARGLSVQIAGRLIGHQEFGVVHERPRDRDALLLAARQLRWRVM